MTDKNKFKVGDLLCSFGEGDETSESFGSRKRGSSGKPCNLHGKSQSPTRKSNAYAGHRIRHRRGGGGATKAMARIVELEKKTQGNLSNLGNLKSPETRQIGRDLNDDRDEVSASRYQAPDSNDDCGGVKSPETRQIGRDLNDGRDGVSASRYQAPESNYDCGGVSTNRKHVSDLDDDIDVLSARRKAIRAAIKNRQDGQSSQVGDVNERNDKVVKAIDNLPSKPVGGLDDEEQAARKRYAKLRMKQRALSSSSDEHVDRTHTPIVRVGISGLKAGVGKDGTVTRRESFSSASSSSSDSDDSMTSSSSTASSDNNLQSIRFVPKQSRTQQGIVQRGRMVEQQESQTLFGVKRDQQLDNTIRQISAQVARDEKNADEKSQRAKISLLSLTENMPDDTDGLDEILEYTDWEIRELSRLNLAKEEKDKRTLELQDTERRRNLTDAERSFEDAELARKGIKKPQREEDVPDNVVGVEARHHRGAFYMDEETLRIAEISTGKSDVRRRDISRAVTGIERKSGHATGFMKSESSA